MPLKGPIEQALAVSTDACEELKKSKNPETLAMVRAAHAGAARAYAHLFFTLVNDAADHALVDLQNEEAPK